MKFTAAQSEFIELLGCNNSPAHKQLALVSVAESCPGAIYDRERTRAAIRRRAPEIFRRHLREQQKYGFVITLIVLGVALVAFEAALSWAVERFLDWLFPSGDEACESRRGTIAHYQRRWGTE